jgi:hypothetical protein
MLTRLVVASAIFHPAGIPCPAEEDGKGCTDPNLPSGIFPLEENKVRKECDNRCDV